MNVINDDLGRDLSPQQADFFKDSVIRDENGKLKTMYHGSSYDFDAFDPSHIRAFETDAYYNGFWFSDDAHTLPAWTRLKARYEVYLNVCNPAPMDVIRKVIQEVRKQNNGEEDMFHKESRSIPDEVRYRLMDMGYDGIIHDWKPKINEQELEETGQTKVVSTRGTEYLLKKNEEWGGLDLFYYDMDEPNHEGENLTGYDDVADYLSLQYSTVVCFYPEQIKAIDNRTPTKDPNFKHNEIEKEAPKMSEQKGYIYTDSFGDDNILYPKINFYLDNNNIYLGFDAYDPDLEDIDFYPNAIGPYCDATVNIDTLPYLEACIDTNNNGDKMVDFLVQNGFGEPTGRMASSGYCWYPIFRFKEEKLREIDPDTFAAYAKAHGKDKQPLDAKIQQAKEKSVGQNRPKQEALEKDR